jgi:hypothetical protein
LFVDGRWYLGLIVDLRRGRGSDSWPWVDWSSNGSLSNHRFSDKRLSLDAVGDGLSLNRLSSDGSLGDSSWLDNGRLNRFSPLLLGCDSSLWLIDLAAARQSPHLLKATFKTAFGMHERQVVRAANRDEVEQDVGYRAPASQALQEVLKLGGVRCFR